MAVTPFKTFSAGEILTAADLNSSFSQITSNGEDLGWPATKAKDLNGNELILDGDADTSITADTDDQVDFKLGGVDVLRLNTVLSAVNGIDFTAAATGNAPFYSAFGSDTNVSLDLKPKGTGGVRILDKNGNEILVGADGIASAVNELTVQNAATANAPQLQATGGDTNIGINLVPKGTGTVQVAGTRVLAEDHPITTRGDIIRGNSSASADRLALGAANLLLGSDGTDILYLGGAELKTTDYTVLASEHLKMFRVNGASTITLPTLASAVDFFQCTIVNVGTDTITVKGNGSENIRGPDGTTNTVTLPSAGDNITVMNGSAWEVISLYRKLIHGLQTPIATTSGTTHDFTILPDSSRVTVFINQASLTSTALIGVQLGDAGGIEATGYVGTTSVNGVGHTAWSTFAPISRISAAANTWITKMVWTLGDDNNTWFTCGVSSLSGGAVDTHQYVGLKSLSGELTTLRVMGGTFDAGSVNVLEE